jgi:hypothetical protein
MNLDIFNPFACKCTIKWFINRDTDDDWAPDGYTDDGSSHGFTLEVPLDIQQIG